MTAQRLATGSHSQPVIAPNSGGRRRDEWVGRGGGGEGNRERDRKADDTHCTVAAGMTRTGALLVSRQ